MKGRNLRVPMSVACAVMGAVGASAWAATGVQVGASGKSYASAGVQCALHPVAGMAPVVQAGLYNPKKNAKGVVSLNGEAVATVTFLTPDTNAWLANGTNTVVVTLDRKTADSYVFDASTAHAGQPNVCIPDTAGNSVSGETETAASGRSYATVTPGCAWSALTGRAQPYVNLFDNGRYLLNVSVNNVPLTQLNGTTRTHTPVFLSAGLNVISAVNGAVIDYYVRDGGSGSCTLP